MSAVRIAVDPHPLLAARAFVTRFPAPLAQLADAARARLGPLLALDADVPFERDESVRACVRALLRHGGHRTSGRGKPASEYLVRAAGEGALGSINAAVDACNAVSLATGFPISVVDRARAAAPYRIGIGADGEEYVFNASGQPIALRGLLCLYDASGPCATPVKDSQRTKTDDATSETLSVVWGASEHAERADRTVLWYRELLGALGATSEPVELG